MLGRIHFPTRLFQAREPIILTATLQRRNSGPASGPRFGNALEMYIPPHKSEWMLRKSKGNGKCDAVSHPHGCSIR